MYLTMPLTENVFLAYQLLLHLIYQLIGLTISPVDLQAGMQK